MPSPISGAEGGAMDKGGGGATDVAEGNLASSSKKADKT